MKLLPALFLLLISFVSVNAQMAPREHFKFAKFSFEKVLLFSFLVAVLRWVALFFLQSGALILMSQLLHAVTYGAFHMASILYIDALSPAEHKTMGQAVNNAVTYGLGLMAGFFATGILYDRFGSFYLFAMSGGVALAGGVIFQASLALKQKNDNG